MKVFHYLIIADIILLLLSIKFIFGNAGTFMKAIVGHVFSDFDEIATFRKWDKENHIQHKTNLFYAAALLVGILSFSVFVYWL